jgi:ABC-type multidrug transport system fused ATPase/permease subunit
MADSIFYLQDGLLVEQGTHAELMAKQGLYYALMLQQEGTA